MKAASFLLVSLAPLIARAQTVPHLRLQEDLRLGDGLTDSVTFTRVVSIVPGSNGTFYVADSEDKWLRWFDRGGRLLKTIGREGGGPGEFRALAAAGSMTDTIWAMDTQIRRVSLFTTDGTFLRTLPAPMLATVRPSVRALASKGWIVQTVTFVSTTGTNHGSNNAVVLLARNMESADTIAVLKFGVGDWLYRASGRTPFSVIVPNPFNDGSLFDTDSKGAYLTVVHREVGTGRASAFQVLRLDASGRILWQRRFSYTPRTIPPAVKDSVSRSREIRTIATFPVHMPAVSIVVAGEDGTVWLRREELARNGMSEWNVLAPDGRMIGRFEAPKRLQIHSATAQQVMAVVPNENDVPIVIRYLVSAVK